MKRVKKAYDDQSEGTDDIDGPKFSDTTLRTQTM